MENLPAGEEAPLVERIDDLQAYARLLRLVEELEQIATRCWSISSAAAVLAASRLVRVLASALYHASLRRSRDDFP